MPPVKFIVTVYVLAVNYEELGRCRPQIIFYKGIFCINADDDISVVIFKNSENPLLIMSGLTYLCQLFDAQKQKQRDLPELLD